MKKQLLLFAFGIVSFSAAAQTVLVVDDNDYITENSDTLVANLAETTYSNFDYWNVADSTFTPDSEFLGDYDLVIWYASTDGDGLGFWDAAGTAGDPELISYIETGGRVWIIGADILYDGGYDVPTTFSAGDFVYDYMGVVSYDAQSYGDDGNMGVSKMEVTTEVPAYFPDELYWIFPTFWWADAVTSRDGAKDMYIMGPDSYVLYESVSMTHYRDGANNVMSTFFDPALINTPENRIAFLEHSIYYLMNFDLGIGENTLQTLTAYPNPATDRITVISENDAPQGYALYAVNGTLVQSGVVQSGENVLSVDQLESGIYTLRSGNAVQKVVLQR